MRTISSVVLIVILTGILANCTGASSGTITIAVVESDPGGKGSPNAQSVYAGVQLAVDQINQRGGIDGRNVAIEIYQDDDDPASALKIANEITQGNAVAVIGHSAIETSDVAAKVYDSNHIPAIGVIPATAHLTESHPYYFNITYTAELQAAYLANYVRKIQGQNTASIIFSSDAYDSALAEKFAHTFTGIGGIITFNEKIGANASDQAIEQLVTRFVTADTSQENPGSILIAADVETSARLIIKMNEKGLDYPILGGDNFSSPEFIKRMSEESEEKVQAGALTDGLLTTSSIIFDSASRFAHQFLDEYRIEYPQNNSGVSSNNDYNRNDPGARVVNGYNAALVLLSAIQRAGLGDADIRASREKIYQSLLDMDSATNGTQGITGPLFFDPSRNAASMARLGVYQNDQLISAMTQFEPVITLEQFKPEDLQAQLDQHRIMTLNGKYVYVENVVYTGVDMIDIHDVDIKTSTYVMDFYLWFRYRANSEDKGFNPADFVFTNAVSLDDGWNTPVRPADTTDGITTETYRVTGTFKNQFYFYEYPFDTQNLSIQYRNKDATTTFIQYVVDRIGMQYQSEKALTKHFGDNGAFNALNGWKINQASAEESIFSTTSTLGNPQNFGRYTTTDFSLMNVNVEVQRNSLQFIIKSLLPLLFTLILAYITFFLPLGHSERLGVGSTALLTTAFFHLSLADALPQIGYTVAMEYLFYASYLMSAAIVFLETISIRLEKRSEAEKSKKVKEELQQRRQRLNLIGRIVYPLILASVLLGGVLMYNGILNLGPKTETDSQNLVTKVLSQTFQVFRIASPTPASPQPVNAKVVLSLGTWRPEDTENMKKLLAEFHEYALKEKKKDITIKYEAVIGANYDTLLSAQLAKGQAPDLFYVHPYTVDGDLARHLVELSTLDIADKFEPSESSAWQNKLDGKYYAMPYVGVVQGVYYNKDFFDAHDLKVPATWEEFLDVAKAIKEAGKTPIGNTNALNENQDSEMFQSILASFIGGPEGHAKFAKTDGASLCFDNLRMVRAFQAIEDIKPYLLPNAATTNDTKGKESFISQRSIMLFGGSWDVEYFSNNAKSFNWSVFAPPAPAGQQTYIIFQPDAGVGINKASAHREEALLFLQWLMADGAKSSEKYLPGRYPLINKAGERSNNTLTGHDADFSKLTTSYPSDIRWLSTDVDSQHPRASEIVRQALLDLIAGDSLSPAQAAQRLQDGLGEWYEPAQTCK